MVEEAAVAREAALADPEAVAMVVAASAAAALAAVAAVVTVPVTVVESTEAAKAEAAVVATVALGTAAVATAPRQRHSNACLRNRFGHSCSRCSHRRTTCDNMLRMRHSSPGMRLYGGCTHPSKPLQRAKGVAPGWRAQAAGGVMAVAVLAISGAVAILSAAGAMAKSVPVRLYAAGPLAATEASPSEASMGEEAPEKSQQRRLPPDGHPTCAAPCLCRCPTWKPRPAGRSPKARGRVGAQRGGTSHRAVWERLRGSEAAGPGLGCGLGCGSLRSPSRQVLRFEGETASPAFSRLSLPS